MLFYRALAALALAAYAPFALLRSTSGRRRIGDVRGRLGRSDYPDLDGGIWIHAVSVGEVGVARSLLGALRRARPGCRIGLSVTTAAGRELALRTVSQEAPVFAFPFELAGPIERAFSATRPGLVLLTETEIWPLFLERAAGRGVAVALVNGRISERSFRRYRRVRGFLRATLGRIGLFAMQSAEDARRVTELGADAARVHVAGNLKYDRPAAPAFADAVRLRAAAAGRPVVVAGSTGEGEEALVLDAWRRQRQPALLVLAPRRPERFEEIARLCEARGLQVLRRSAPETGSAPRVSPADVYLLDSIGELASVYSGAVLAFVGASLIPRGGQNPIEAWAAGVPVVAGPHMENFREVAAAGKARGILDRVQDASELADAFAAALAAPEQARSRGAEAERFVAESRGAADRAAEMVLALLPVRAAKEKRA